MIATRLLGIDPGTGPLDALRILGTDTDTDAVLVHAPQSRSNPFADLLNRGLADAGISAVPAADAVAAAEFAVRLAQLSGGRIGCVVHLHWLHRITATAPDERRARDAVEVTVTALQRARAAGARMLWTVHNLGPHRSRHPVAETSLRRQIAALADLVHVMNPNTVEALGHGVELDPGRLVTVAHPSYLGAYPDTVSTARAREVWGLKRNAVVFAVLGRIQAYKELDVLADAFDQLSAAEPGRFRLLVVGAVDGVGPGRSVRARPGPTDPAIGALLTRFAHHPDVVCHPLAIPDSQIQLVLRAADIAVVPNRVPLNSGAELLALSFGVPVVTTDAVASDAGWGIGALPGDATALAAALRRAVTRFTGPAAGTARAAAVERARAVSPGLIGPRFARIVRGLLNQPPRPVDHPDAAGHR